MRKKILQLTLIATIVIFSACSNDNVLTETKEREISFTASMSQSDPSTRVDLDQLTDGRITLRWVVGDEIVLAFMQGTTKIKTTVSVASISDEGKKAHFKIPVPESITGAFKLYGVFGGGGIDIVNFSNPIAIIPTDAGSAGTLASVQSRKDVMLYFSKEIQSTDKQASVDLKHIGSLFSINYKAIENVSIINEFRIKAVTGDLLIGRDAFNLETEKFENRGTGTTAGKYIRFSHGSSPLTVPANEVVTFYAWYPIVPNSLWPDLQFEMTGQVGNDAPNTIYKTTKPKLGRTPSPANHYYFFVSMSGNKVPTFENDL